MSSHLICPIFGRQEVNKITPLLADFGLVLVDLNIIQIHKKDLPREASFLHRRHRLHYVAFFHPLETFFWNNAGDKVIHKKIAEQDVESKFSAFVDAIFMSTKTYFVQLFCFFTFIRATLVFAFVNFSTYFSASLIVTFMNLNTRKLRRTEISTSKTRIWQKENEKDSLLSSDTIWTNSNANK